MHLLRSAFFGLLLLGSLFNFQACRKEAMITEQTTAITETDCPDPAHALAQRLAAQTQRNAALSAFFSQTELAELRANTCLARTLSSTESVAEDRASGLKNRFWTPGTEIRVRFLNGSAALQQKVFSNAQTWESYANITFKKVSSGASEVRVLFGEDGHWSYIGTDNRSIEACAETMSLQLTDQTQANEIRRVTLHEFGHVLGMLHEHQQPLASIPWNTTAVYAYYAQQDWSRQEVDEQVLGKNAAETTQYTGFDAASIMEYPVSASLTTNGYSIPWNTQLSAADKSFIGLMYGSRRIQVRHAAAYNTAITFQVAGINHTIRQGESLSVPVSSGANTLSIWERPGAGAWSWDNAYAVSSGKNYKIVKQGTSTDFSLVVE